ncbi:PP2C family protein-serine/threonine phosphatase [Nocardioides sp. CER19]|uniref:PP2C family protein-serine/threonine phosphatase n=1 Tax=Nocardioides sp. CER19 TaxID=3038538 RepID=UPI00244C0806|nr:PP2C family protein-serine/threonine phosphatase [Nocardioides sp. CER19]MDH2415728.1 PP2C family protein-serine/threonine phosphatase [Nocardioides sp. CER19]
MLQSRLGRGPGDLARRWRTGSARSQRQVLGVLLVGLLGCLLVSWFAYEWLPMGAFFLWPLLGLTLLRFRPLSVLTGATVVAVLVAYVHNGGQMRRLGVVDVIVGGLAIGIMLWQSSRQRSGLPVGLSEAVLAKLRDRLQQQGRVPVLPSGWRCQSAMIAAAGTGYAGDFLVADLRDGHVLEVVLVDVCGKGTAVGPQALQFAGALGGLIGALPPERLMRAANAFLMRQHSDDTFSTAVHLLVDLADGSYRVTSAGHPPALRWQAAKEEWVIDNARGTALGVVEKPQFHASSGVLDPGDALMFYTDGVIERRRSDIDAGIAWLRGVAERDVLSHGFDGAPGRILARVDDGDDDRAVLILSRCPAAALV